MGLLFRPFGIVAGLAAGMLARKLFDKGWSSIDDDDPPQAAESDVEMPKLVISLLLEGAIFALVKGLVDHGARSAFARYTGVWPGEKK